MKERENEGEREWRRERMKERENEGEREWRREGEIKISMQKKVEKMNNRDIIGKGRQTHSEWVCMCVREKEIERDGRKYGGD